MNASDHSRNGPFAQDGSASFAQDSTGNASRTGRLSFEDWQDDSGDEVTTPRLSLTRKRDSYDHEAGRDIDCVPGIGWLP